MIRRALLVLAVFAAATASARGQDDDEEIGPPRILVGMLTEQATRVCFTHHEPMWTDERLEIGFVRLVEPPPGAKVLAGKPVIAEGDPDPDFRGPQIVHTGDCPPQQTRSDWVQGKDGMRLRREPGAPFRAFRAERLSALAETGTKVEGDEVQARFRQPVATRLADVTLRAWYEGCYGKPGVASRETTVLRVPEGQVVTARFPARIVEPERPEGRREHRIQSVQVLTSDPRVVFDLDLPVPGVGCR